MFEDDKYEPVYMRKIVLELTHPSINPHDLEGLGAAHSGSYSSPYSMFKPGSLEFKIAPQTVWRNYAFLHDEEVLEDVISQMVENLYADYRNFFQRISSEGGQVMLVVCLPEGHSQDVSVPQETSQKMADMSMTLSVQILGKEHDF